MDRSQPSSHLESPWLDSEWLMDSLVRNLENSLDRKNRASVKVLSTTVSTWPNFFPFAWCNKFCRRVQIILYIHQTFPWLTHENWMIFAEKLTVIRSLIFNFSMLSCFEWLAGRVDPLSKIWILQSFHIERMEWSTKICRRKNVTLKKTKFSSFGSDT